MTDQLFVFIASAVPVLVMAVIFRVMFRKQRYHEARQQVDVRNLAEYGPPAKSLYTGMRLFSLQQRMAITDESDQPVYLAHSKVFSLRDMTWIETAEGEPVACVWRKVLSLHARHFVEMTDGTRFQVSSELFHLMKDIVNIEELGWVLEGNILGLNFVLKDAEGDPVAAIGQKILSIHNRFSIDIYQPRYERIVVAIVVTLQHMLRDRQAAQPGGSANSSLTASVL